jgi:endo-1,4-beta-mannosidase
MAMSFDASRFRLGINYWPSSTAMRWWQRFDLDEVERDFARIRGVGLDSVRIFLLWEDFQPTPDQVSKHALDRLVLVADAARARDLSLLPTLFTGHMSGVNWLPDWAVDPHARFDSTSPEARFRVVSDNRVRRGKARNWYSDRIVGDAQEQLAAAAAAALQGHPALWAWDLGNENSNCCVPPTRQAGVAWLERMSTCIRAADSTVAITIGLHMEDLIEDRRLGPREAGRFCDFLCMHGYPIYADFVEGPTDEWLLPFLGLITRWLGGREVLFEEFGGPALRPGSELDRARAASPHTALLAEESAAAFTRRALEALHDSGCSGAMLWCYRDYAEALWNAPPLDTATWERWFGLWRADGTPKPAVAEVTSFENLLRVPPRDVPWIDIDREEFSRRPHEHLRRLYLRFCQQSKRTARR